MTAGIGLGAVTILFAPGAFIGSSLAFVRASMRAFDDAKATVAVRATLVGISLILMVVGVGMFTWFVGIVASNPVWSVTIDLLMVITGNLIGGAFAYYILNGGFRK